MLLLNPERSILAITNQSIRDLAKRALARLFVGQTHLLVLCLGQTNVRLKPSCLEDGLSYGGSQIPYASRTGEEIRQRRTLVTGDSRERNLGEVCRRCRLQPPIAKSRAAASPSRPYRRFEVVLTVMFMATLI
jgi:hypothetical protein